MLADLHIHTTASDGLLSIDQVISQAISKGLHYISITDHDTVDSILNLNNVIEDLVVIPGIEFSIDYPQNEIHILGYRIDYTYPQFQDELQKLKTSRLTRIAKMVEKVRELGYDIDYNNVLEIAGESKSIGRPHVARALLEKGYFRNIQQVFHELLNPNAPAYVPHYKLTINNAINLILSVQGIPVLAHPGLVGDNQLVENIIKAGIKGIEVYHPVHSLQQIAQYEELAQKYNLLLTGGSDFHGMVGRYPEHIGDYTIPSEHAVKLLNYEL